MDLPFTANQFFGVFTAYNHAIWPAQLVAYALGLIAMVLALWGGTVASRIIAATLAAFWLWDGVAYHWMYFRPVNPMAAVFAALFVLQGLVFLGAGVFGKGLQFRARLDLNGVFGLLMILYALAGYALVGMTQGHGYPSGPMFGVAPCPMVIFTFGLLLWASKPVRWYVVLIPLLWSVVGFTAALQLEVLEDLGLLVAGVLGTVLLWVRWRKGEG